MSSKPAPPLNAPSSDSTVTVSIIDSTTWLEASTALVSWKPEIKGFNKIQAGSWSFLIEHPSGRKLLYDLGTRKDWQNLAPSIALESLIEMGVVDKFIVEKNLSEILTEGGMNLEQIEGIIWSHWHFDHIGDPSTFPSSTKLIVGEGFKKKLLPGYPADANSFVLEADFKDRELMEIDFSKTDVLIGRFKAFDYFGDGSFYILDSPGHAVGHVNALARTHPSPSAAFIHLGGDSIHHAAEFRPSEYLPLPDEIRPSPVPKIHHEACPGHFFGPVLRNGSKTEPLFEVQDPHYQGDGVVRMSMVYDEPALRDTVRKDEELDADEDVFTIIAHDWSLKGILDEWPNSLNSWKEKGWKSSTRWKFLEDFEEACLLGHS